MVASVRLPLYCLVVSLLSFCLSWLSVIRHYLSPCSHTFRFFMRCLSLSACPYLSLHLPSLFSISTPMPISSFVIPWYISSLSVPLAFYFFPSYLFVPIVLSVFLCTSYPPPPVVSTRLFLRLFLGLCPGGWTYSSTIYSPV